MGQWLSPNGPTRWSPIQHGKSVDAHEVLPLWLGGNLEEARPRHIQASPLNWVTPNAAPTLLIHGTEDKYVAYEQALWMRDRLKDGHVSVFVEVRQLTGRFIGQADIELVERYVDHDAIVDHHRSNMIMLNSS